MRQAGRLWRDWGDAWLGKRQRAARSGDHGCPPTIHARSPAAPPSPPCRRRLVGEREWDDEDGEALPQFVGEALSKYLKVEVRV